MTSTNLNGEHFVARPYQNEIMGMALKNNVIIYLPTGAGKTHIAIMALKEMSGALVNSMEDGGKRSVFIVNTVALARQQADCIRRMTSLKVNIYIGEMNVDNWQQEKWRAEINSGQVIVATCQIMLDIVRHGFVSLSEFNLLIFDECHHANKDHPMHQLMSQFQRYSSNELPRVIGLTGILLSSPSVGTIEKDLNAMEATFCATIVTVSDSDMYQSVLSYSTKPREFCETYLTENRTETIQKLVDLVEGCQKKIKNWNVVDAHMKSKNLATIRAANPVKKPINMWHDFIQRLDDMGAYGGSIGILSIMVEFELKKRAAETIMLRNLNRVCISYAERIRHELMEHMCDDPMSSLNESILNNSSSKILQLIGYMEKNFKGKNFNDIKCLVFVERRQTAKCLYYVLKHYCETSKSIPIVPTFMVGRHENMVESIESYLDVKNNKNALNRFRRNEYNLIVCSSVLEEGIDLQSCNYVIMYDEIKTFRTYIQTKGRARMKDSQYLLLIPNNNLQKTILNIKKYRDIEEELKKYLIYKTINRTLPLQEEIDDEFNTNIEPYYTSSGAILEGMSAISILNRYCMSLPRDNFTVASIQWSKKDCESGIVVTLMLPLQSTVKDGIESDPMPSVKQGKRSAAMKACILLHKNKELNDHLLPITKNNCLEQVNDVYFKHWERYAADNAKEAGTVKYKRPHQIQYPKQLFSGMPQVGKYCYLYNIHLTPSFQRNNDNTHILDLLELPSHYAILIANPIPKIAKMPLFLSQGEVTAHITYEPIRLNISTQQEIDCLRNFHVMLFRDLLFTWKSFFANNYQNVENSFLIVPTKNNAIDWKLVYNFQQLAPIRQLTEMERSRLTHNPEDYENTVVVPWYSADQKTRYFVQVVRTDLTPYNAFPNQQYKNFASYIDDKYKLNVMKKNQFMLLVKPLTSTLNLLHSGKGEAGSKKKTRHLDDILLIPEMCHNFKFPAEMWLKAIFLPSILHRLHYLLLAEEIRIQINSFLHIETSNYIPSRLRNNLQTKITDSEPVDWQDTTMESSYPISNEKSELPINNFIDQHQEMWKAYEEPLDLSRHVDKIYEIELDYYHQFITNSLNISSKESSPTIVKFEAPAICGPPSKKVEIGILQRHKEPTIIEQEELLVALTRASACDVFNMERLEVLGDSFLKFSISLYLLHKHTRWNEGCLTELKGKFVSNRNLFYCATEMNIPGCLNIISFNPRNEWQPPLVSVPVQIEHLIISKAVSANILWKLELADDEIQSGIVKDAKLQEFMKKFEVEDPDPDSPMQAFLNKRMISDKSSADCMEALLGVCLRNLGIHQTFKLLGFFGICSKNEALTNLLELKLGSPRLKANITDTDVDSFLINYGELEKNLGYKFKDRAYLLQALTHPSYPTNRITGCYQVLEFLGDAILDFLISCYIFEKCGDMDPGMLTDLRASLVNNVTLACLTVRNRFHLFMLSQSATLLQAIEKFSSFQETEKFKVTDQVRILIQEEECSMADYVDVPKALGDIFEALIGAVFLDSNNDLEVTWGVIYHLMSAEIEEYILNVPKQIIRQLYESKADPKFSEAVTEENYFLVSCKFMCRGKECVVDGFGNNNYSAKISAAKLALQALNVN